MKKFYLLILCFISISTLAQQITFNKTFGLSPYIADAGNTLIEIPGVGYMIPRGFWAYLIDSSRVVITTLDYNGNIIADKQYGKDGEVYTTYKIVSTSDSNYILIGTFRETTNNYVYSFIYKLNSLGDTLWTKTYSSGQKVTWLVDLTETKDKGFVMTGISQDFQGANYQQSQIYVIKTDSLGNIEWDYFFGNSTDYEYATTVIEGQDSTIMLIGYRFVISTDKNQGLLLKLDNGGNYIDDTIITAPLSLAYSGAMLSLDGYIYIAGSFEVSLTPYKGYGYIAKFDQNFNLIWSDTLISGIGNYFEDFFDIVQNNDILILSGASTRSSTNGTQNGWIAAYDTNGNALWERIIYKTPNQTDLFNSLIATSDGGYLMCGFAQVYDSLYNNWNAEVWVVKVDSSGCDIDGCPTILWTSVDEINSSSQQHLNIYPNPFSNFTTIEYTVSDIKDSWMIIYDVTGKAVKKIKLDKETGTFEFNGKDLNNGIYFCQLLSNGEIMQTTKLVLTK
jgi:hypothetical protein